uniref:Cell cycle control protein 50C n=1 Tax=Crocodylus porosus TaxID=8502 RepID=A0A7M4E903_CROPO
MEEDAQPPNSRCPDNSAFRQQKLSAWQPKLTPASVLSGFILISVFCLTMGVCLILSAKSVKEVQINYSDKCLICSKLRENSSNWNTECLCSADFKLEEKIQVSNMRNHPQTIATKFLCDMKYTFGYIRHKMISLKSFILLCFTNLKPWAC